MQQYCRDFEQLLVRTLSVGQTCERSVFYRTQTRRSIVYDDADRAESSREGDTFEIDSMGPSTIVRVSVGKRMDDVETIRSRCHIDTGTVSLDRIQRRPIEDSRYQGLLQGS